MFNNRFVIVLVSAFCLPVFTAGDATAGGLNEGKVLYESGDLVGARQVFEKVAVDEPHNARAAFLLGLTFMDSYQFEESVEWFEKATRLDPEVSRYHQFYAEALGKVLSDANTFTKMRKAGTVRAAFERAIELDPANFDARLGLVRFYLEAPPLAGGGRDKAEEEASTIAAGNTLAGHRAWLEIYAAHEEYSRALSELDAIIKSDPDDENALLLRGVMLTAQKNYEPALRHFQSWLKRAPDAMQARYQLGRISALSGLQLEQGEAALLAYGRYAPKPGEPPKAWAYFRLGEVYQHMGNSEAARKAFHSAIELDPRHKQAREALEKLN